MRLDCTGSEPRIDLQDPSLRLTAAQKQAMRFDTELVVTAGAGAGKTTVLALRYVALLLALANQAVRDQPMSPRPDIAQVLVLTFTEKAAKEMGERCYRRLIALSDAVRRQGTDRQSLIAAYGSETPGRLAAALDHLIDHFEAARIGTFHGYCARILRSFPGECGTPPDFEIMDDVTARQLRSELADRTLRAAYSAEPDRLRLLANAVGGHSAVRGALQHALDHRSVLRPILTRHAHGEVTLRDLLALFPQTPEQLLFWLETTAIEVLEAILDAVALSGGGDRIPGLRVLLGRIEDLRDDDEPDALDIASTYHDLLESLCVASGRSVRKLDTAPFLGTVEHWRTTGRAHRDDAKMRLELVQEQCQDWPDRLKLAKGLPRAADAGMLGALQVLGEVFVQAEAALNTAFERADAIDFDALQDRAVAAVRTHPQVRAALAAEHRYLMVDEFQDTDARQWQLVRAIARPTDAPSDRVFVVGDAKQAIYRFRGGDVSVYRRAMSELGTEPVVFPDNFRSRTGLIDWFNHFFGRIMGPPSARRPAFEAPYSPLTAGRSAAGGSVTLAIHASTSAAEVALDEAEACARLIAGRVLPQAGDFEDLDLPAPGVRGDPPIAILLRTRTHMSVFEAALRRHGVSHIVARGVSFWSRPEVCDAVNLLDALATGESISVIGALRSPWIGLSDQDLQDLMEGEWGGPADGDYLAAFGTYELDDLAPPRVLRAAAMFGRLRALRDRLPVSRFLRAVVDETAAVHAMSLDDPSGQAVANVSRLIDRVRTLDPEGLHAAATWLVRQVQATSKESEAIIPPTDARVVLMTVHASKGLEFPVVFVPGCGTASRGRPASLTHGSLGEAWHVACRALDPQAPVRVRVKTGLHGLLSAQEEEEVRAEAKRLLYVAATRARDHLILMGTQPSASAKDRAPSTWSEMLAAVHGVEDAEGQRLLVPTGDIAELEPGHRDHLRIIDLATCLAIEPPHSQAAQGTAGPDADALARLAPLPVGKALEISPSSLDLLVSEPARWYKRARLGVPDDATPRREAARIQLAAARGEVIHSLLEDDLIDDTDRAIARWRARAFQEGAPPDMVADGIPDLLAHLARTAADARVTRRLVAHGMSEVRFRLPLQEVVLNGQIDRLWQDDSGAWVVLDWKSERVVGSAIEAARHHARQLVAYAWAASRILTANGQPGVERCEVYFTATGELVSIGPLDEAHLGAIEGELIAAGELGAQSWEQVLAGDAIQVAVLDVDALPMHVLTQDEAEAEAEAEPEESPFEEDLELEYDPEFAPSSPVVEEPAAAPDPFAALRKALGLGPAATGHTPVSPRRTAVPETPPFGPDPPPAEPEEYVYNADQDEVEDYPWEVHTFSDAVEPLSDDALESSSESPPPDTAPTDTVPTDTAPPAAAPDIAPIDLESLPDVPAFTDEVPLPTGDELTRLSAEPARPDTPVPPQTRSRPRPKRRTRRRHATSPNQLSLFGGPPPEDKDG